MFSLICSLNIIIYFSTPTLHFPYKKTQISTFFIKIYIYSMSLPSTTPYLKLFHYIHQLSYIKKVRWKFGGHLKLSSDFLYSRAYSSLLTHILLLSNNSLCYLVRKICIIMITVLCTE